MTVLAAFFALLSTGCGSGAGQNSLFRGSYGGGQWAVANRAADSGSVSFTVSEKGHMEGLINTGTETLKLTGFLENDGTFGATVRRGDEEYPVNGRFARQEVAVVDVVAEPNDDGTPKMTFLTGLAGNFRQTVNGEEFVGEFTGAGGNVQSAQ